MRDDGVLGTVKSPPPIPTPPQLRWREFRIKILPTIVFLAVMAVTVSVWVRYAAAPNVVGQAETIHADLVSSKPGILTQFTVTLNRPVQAGDVLAVVIPDPRVLERSLALIQAEIEVDETDIPFVTTGQPAKVKTVGRGEWRRWRVNARHPSYPGLKRKPRINPATLATATQFYLVPPDDPFAPGYWAAQRAAERKVRRREHRRQKNVAPNDTPATPGTP